MTLIHNSVLHDCIEREKAGVDYICMGGDRTVLLNMMATINSQKGTNFQYLAELDAFHVLGAGEIIAEYIKQFSSPSVKAYLIPQLVLDKVKDCDKIILQMYLQFRESEEFIAPPGKPAPSHISVRYDNAFRSMKSKRIVDELVGVVLSPRDAFYLPLTVKMLASWKIPELKKALLVYSAPNGISKHDVGLHEDAQVFPPFSFIRRELRFTAIDGLRYYPSEETLCALQLCLQDSDRDIRVAASRIIKKIS